MVSASVTDWVLQSIDPMAVFSGDDHDHCEHRHTRIMSNTSKATIVDGFKADEIPELTVKSVSMTEGVRKPGFARLSLFSPPSSASSSLEQRAAMAYTPCPLPDQIAIWTHLYLPFFVVSMVGLFIWPRYTQSRSDTAGYLPLNNQHKRDDDDPPMASERGIKHAMSNRGTAQGWKQDVLAVAVVALPFWIFCQTHFLF